MKEVRESTIFLICVLLLSSLYGMFEVEKADGSGGSFGGGSGTLSDPYLIEDVWDLQNISKNLSAHYVLANDIDASDTVNWNDGAGFAPISNSSSYSFTFSLDGKGHNIIGLFIDRPDTDYVGLFKSIYMWNKISNISLKNVNFTGRSYVGGIAGYTSYGSSVISIEINGDLSGTGSYIGGIIGQNSGKVSFSKMTGNVVGTGGVGGLIGSNYGSILNSSSYNVEVVGNHSVGGIVGLKNGDSIHNCSFDGNITGNNSIGGLVGSSYLVADFGEISNSHYNIDEVKINGEHILTIGGLYIAQYKDWYDNGMSLNISDYNEVLVPYCGYYNISNVQGMKDLLGFSDFEDLRFRLTADVDLSDHYGLHIPYFRSKEFDGNGHMISNIILNQSFINNKGFFGRYIDGIIDDLVLSNITLTGRSIIGGIVGYNSGTISNSSVISNIDGISDLGGLVGMNGGSIINSSTSGTVCGDQYIGGLVGYNYESGSILNSSAFGSVDGLKNIGGLVGYNRGTISDSSSETNVTGNLSVGGLVGYNSNNYKTFGMISNCTASGNVSGNKSIGGLAGSNYGFVTLSSAYGRVQGNSNVGGLIGYNYLNSISNSFSKVYVYGNSSVGGLIGYGDHKSSNILSYSHSDGKVVGNTSVGGLVGKIDGGSIFRSFSLSDVVGSSNVGGLVGEGEVEISCSYSRGNVTGKEYVGGLGGSGGRKYSEIGNSYAAGNVSGNSFVGGLCGAFGYLSVSNSYAIGAVTGGYCSGGLVGATSNDGRYIYGFWDIETTGQTTSCGGTGKTTKEMKLKKTFIDSHWDFDEIWGIAGNITYPFFKWQDVEPPMAEAGPNQTVMLGADGKIQVNFDGTASKDNYGVDNYTWSFSYNDSIERIYGNFSRFIYEVPDTYIVELNVTDGVGYWDTDNMTITIIDVSSPIADAGPDQFVDEGEWVIFDGNRSLDNYEVVNYTWEFTDNGPVALYGIGPGYRFMEPGLIVVTLNLSDAAGNWNTDTMNITVLDITRPMANAGIDLTIDQGEMVQFDGSKSTDNVGTLNYTWTVLEDVPVLLYGIGPTYRFDDAGAFIVILNVTDTAGNWNNDTMTVTVKDTTRPVANAGPDRTVNENEIFMFNGSLSHDNIGIMDYFWTFFDDAFQILDGAFPIYRFEDPGIFKVTLKVIDAEGHSNNDTMVVTVLDMTSPIADAGPDQTIDLGKYISFDGSGSTDNVDIVNYTWMFYHHGPVRLYGIRPTYRFKDLGEFSVRLSVTDAVDNLDTETMTVHMVDISPPLADAGGDITVPAGTLVVLNGSHSFDNGIVHDYEWTFFYHGRRTVLSGIEVEIMFQNGGTYEMILTVTDGSRNNDDDRINITVIDKGIVVGTVLDGNGRPVKGAVVAIEASDGKVYNTTTRTDGSFSLEVYYGPFVWMISKDGYRSIKGCSFVESMNETQLDLSDMPLEKRPMEIPTLPIIVGGSVLALIIMGIAIFWVVSKKRRSKRPISVNEEE